MQKSLPMRATSGAIPCLLGMLPNSYIAQIFPCLSSAVTCKLSWNLAAAAVIIYLYWREEIYNMQAIFQDMKRLLDPPAFSGSLVRITKLTKHGLLFLCKRECLGQLLPIEIWTLCWWPQGGCVAFVFIVRNAGWGEYIWCNTVHWKKLHTALRNCASPNESWEL